VSSGTLNLAQPTIGLVVQDARGWKRLAWWSICVSTCQVRTVLPASAIRSTRSTSEAGCSFIFDSMLSR